MAAKKKVSKKKITKSLVKKPTAKLSKTITTFIDMKRNITAANKQLDEMKSEAYKLEEKLMMELDKLGQTGISVKTGSIKISEKDVFNAKSWKKIEKYVLRTKDFSVFQKRLSSALLKEMFEDTGKTIAGVEHFVKHSLTVSKAR